MSVVGIYPGRASIIAGFSAYVTALLGVSVEGHSNAGESR